MKPSLKYSLICILIASIFTVCVLGRLHQKYDFESEENDQDDGEDLFAHRSQSVLMESTSGGENSHRPIKTMPKGYWPEEDVTGSDVGTSTRRPASFKGRKCTCNPFSCSLSGPRKFTQTTRKHKRPNDSDDSKMDDTDDNMTGYKMEEDEDEDEDEEEDEEEDKGDSRSSVGNIIGDTAEAISSVVGKTIGSAASTAIDATTSAASNMLHKHLPIAGSLLDAATGAVDTLVTGLGGGGSRSDQSVLALSTAAPKSSATTSTTAQQQEPKSTPSSTVPTTSVAESSAASSTSTTKKPKSTTSRQPELKPSSSAPMPSSSAGSTTILVPNLSSGALSSLAAQRSHGLSGQESSDGFDKSAMAGFGAKMHGSVVMKSSSSSKSNSKQESKHEESSSTSSEIMKTSAVE